MRHRPTRHTRSAINGALLLSALALAGCANAGSTATSPTPQKIAFRSPAVSASKLPAQYTCDGRDTWPPLEWGAVPSGTGSLALFVVAILPEPATHTYKVSIEWAVAGLLPTLHKLDPGQLPSYAYVGTNSSGKRGYSLCPPKGSTVQYQFELYGVPSAYGVASSHFSGVQLISTLASPTSTTRASGYGAFIAKYTRG
jgi:phosphatidylethanolamine-binding protein (PEBP) family uncharacterized protein